MLLVDRLKDSFSSTFTDGNLEYVAVAPGRVNLIGEHIDYSGYSVLPMALELCAVVGIKLNRNLPHQIRIHNVVHETYPPLVVSSLEIDNSKPHWANYILCGIKGIVFELNNEFGLDIMVDCNVPAASGLSSSSALVCASALATMAVVNKHFPEEYDQKSMAELAEVCMKSERFIGTMGGGMDQAISFLGEVGTAKFIEFHPLKVSPVFLPDNCCFVVANSLTTSMKALATNPFNIRVVECRVAASLLAHASGLSYDSVSNLGDFAKNSKMPPAQAEEAAKTKLPTDRISFAAAAELLGISPETFYNHIFKDGNKRISEEMMATLQLEVRNRAVHVYSEAARVLLFRDACSNNDSISVLGSLMTASHHSCDQLYDCSSPELNTLVSVMLQCGASGARLTGAGWGGCGVALVDKTTVDIQQFLDNVWKQYYDGHNQPRESLLFASVPAAGARLITL